MKISLFGKTLVIGETDKYGKNIVAGFIDNKTGKGTGIYTDKGPIFER